MLPIKTIALLVFGANTTAAFAGDLGAGQATSVICAACHSSSGTPGKSAVDSFPNLAGQKKGYLIKQLKAFKSGQRVDPTMQPLAASLSDADIENVAEYFASLDG